MNCQKCGNKLKELLNYVYVIPDIGLAVANLKAYVCINPNCNYVEFPVESVDAIERAEEEWRTWLKEIEKTKVGVFLERTSHWKSSSREKSID
ncbi:MAG: hypothetical protein ACE5KT_10225 [Methanosarcinales archaeon]